MTQKVMVLFKKKEEKVFVHFAAIKIEGDGYRTLKEGQAVEFTVTESEKGLTARRSK